MVSLARERSSANPYLAHSMLGTLHYRRTCMVFSSYSATSKFDALQLVNYLILHGYEVWKHEQIARKLTVSQNVCAQDSKA